MTTTIDPQVRARRQAVVDDHVAAENAHDIGGTLKTFAKAHYDVVALGAETDGEGAVQDLLATLFGAFPDFTVTTHRVHHADDAVLTEVTMSGTHRGPWAGVEGTGKPIEVRCCCVFRFDGDALVSESVYFDHATLLAQIGAVG